MNCPECDAKMERISSEFDVGLIGGWNCTACDHFIPEWDVDDEP